jgi:hypothetical protein
VIGYDLIDQRQPIICSNGVTYQSQLEASYALKINQSAISKHLRGKLKHVKGYTFTRQELKR